MSGGGNVLTAEIRDNQIIDCADGIESFLDETPFSSLRLEITGNTIDSPSDQGDGWGRGYGITLQAGYGPVNVFEALIEGNTILNPEKDGMSFILTNGTDNSVNLDAGGGGLGSAGQNRIIGSEGADIVADGVAVSATNNWWGSNTGPELVLEINGGTVDVDPFLTSDPN